MCVLSNLAAKSVIYIGCYTNLILDWYSHSIVFAVVYV